MDTWTSEALALRNDIREVRTTLAGRIDDTKEELTARIDDTKQELTAYIDDTKQELTAYIDDTKQELTARIEDTAQELRAEIADARRHSDVLFESVRGAGLMLGVKMKTDSRAFVTRQFSGVPDDERRLMVCENARRLYRI